MSKSIIDTIDEAIREYNWDNNEEATKLVVDTYTYAMLFEELGLSVDSELSEYRGLVIKVDPDIDDICQIL
jgi:hypothetical protein